MPLRCSRSSSGASSSWVTCCRRSRAGGRRGGPRGRGRRRGRSRRRGDPQQSRPRHRSGGWGRGPGRAPRSTEQRAAGAAGPHGGDGPLPPRPPPPCTLPTTSRSCCSSCRSPTPYSVRHRIVLQPLAHPCAVLGASPRVPLDCCHAVLEAATLCRPVCRRALRLRLRLLPPAPHAQARGGHLHPHPCGRRRRSGLRAGRLHLELPPTPEVMRRAWCLLRVADKIR